MNVSKETLTRLYLDEHKTMSEIADELGIAVGSVHKYMHVYNIPIIPKKEWWKVKGHTMSAEHKERLRAIHKGKVVTEETRAKMSESKKTGGIGHKKKRSDGYVAVYFPDHPKSNKDGYIMEHDLIMECVIGRHLSDDEVVHHKNKKRDDNRK